MERLLLPPSLSLSNCCPQCNSTALARIHRRWWMRLLSQSRFYYCRECGTKFLSLNRHPALPAIHHP